MISAGRKMAAIALLSMACSGPPDDGVPSQCGPAPIDPLTCESIHNLSMLHDAPLEFVRKMHACIVDKPELVDEQRIECLERWCDEGDGHSCEELTQEMRRTGLLSDEDEVGRDEIARYRRVAAEAYSSSCSAKNPEFCHKAGELWRNEADMKDDEDPARLECLLRGREAFSVGCDAGHGHSCFELAVMWKWRFGEGNEEKSRDAYRKAQEHLWRSCAFGVSEDCSTLAMLVGHGSGGPSDCVKSTRIMELACDRGYARGNMCEGVAQSLFLGYCVPRNLEKARSYYESLCGEELAFGVPCIALGQMCEKGLGGPVDLQCAREAYRRECADWGHRGCPHLERLEGVTKSPSDQSQRPRETK